MIFFSPYEFDALFASAADADNLSQLNYMGVRRDGSVIEAPVQTDGSGNSCRQCISAGKNKPVDNPDAAFACCIGCLLLLNFPCHASVKADFRYLLNGL